MTQKQYLQLALKCLGKIIEKCCVEEEEEEEEEEGGWVGGGMVAACKPHSSACS